VIAATDLLVIAASYTLAALLRFTPDTLMAAATGFGGVAIAALLMAVWFAALSAAEAYSPKILLSKRDQIVRLLTASVFAWILTQLAAFLLKVPIPFESRLFALVSLPGVIVLLGIWRLGVIRPLAMRAYPRLARGEVLILGDGDRAARLVARRRSRAHGRLVRFESLADTSPGAAGRLVEEHGFSDVILAPSGLGSDEVFEVAFSCLDAGAEVHIISSYTEALTARATLGETDGAPAMRLRPGAPSGPEAWFKRVVDLAGAGFGLLLLSPLFAAISLAVKLSSPGPVLFRQQRIGRMGRAFTMLKFRTMVDGNDPRIHQEYVKSFIRDGASADVDEHGAKIYKLTADPRVTRVGGVLRGLSLDELPQLWNVLRGEMSLVGPRPCLPMEWRMYQPWQRRRLDALPGCTGLWQVTARSLVGLEEMVLLDLYYAHNGSPGRDLVLIAKTVPAMIRGRGGY
jgi:exopolysaccharide biosynthesis polyprenyl glycosylphosphotransferase